MTKAPPKKHEVRRGVARSVAQRSPWSASRAEKLGAVAVWDSVGNRIFGFERPALRATSPRPSCNINRISNLQCNTCAKLHHLSVGEGFGFREDAAERRL